MDEVVQKPRIPKTWIQSSCLVLVNNVDKTVAIDGNGTYIATKVSKGNIAHHNMHFLLTL